MFRHNEGPQGDPEALRRMREAIRQRLEQEEGDEQPTGQLPVGEWNNEFAPQPYRDLGPQQADDEEIEVLPPQRESQLYARPPVRQTPRYGARSLGRSKFEGRRLMALAPIALGLTVLSAWGLSKLPIGGDSPAPTQPPTVREPVAVSPEAQNAASKAWIGELLARAPQDTESAIVVKIKSGTMSLTDFAHAQAALTHAGARRELFIWYRAHANSGTSPIRGEADPEVAAFLAETNDLNKHLFAGQNKPEAEQAAWESAFVGSRIMLFNHAQFAALHAAVHMRDGLALPKAQGRSDEELAAEIAKATPPALLAEIMARESAGGIYLGADHTVSALDTSQVKQDKAQTAELVRRIAQATDQLVNGDNLLAMPTPKPDNKIALGFSMARIEDTFTVQDELKWNYNPVNGLEWVTAMMMINYKYPNVLKATS